ncbi:MAG TPA: hypothetical protein VFN57_13040, partial [Thermomicrobiaceae bacterium]|nr:hypothetical protein [Thermomicrobiaceae bacterium]
MLHFEVQLLKSAAIVALAVAVALAGRAVFDAVQRTAVATGTVTIQVLRNEPSSRIAAALVRARVIRSATAFSVLARLQLASRQFHAGTYHLTRHMTISRV